MLAGLIGVEDQQHIAGPMLPIPDVIQHSIHSIQPDVSGKCASGTWRQEFSGAITPQQLVSVLRSMLSLNFGGCVQFEGCCNYFARHCRDEIAQILTEIGKSTADTFIV